MRERCPAPPRSGVFAVMPRVISFDRFTPHTSTANRSFGALKPKREFLLEQGMSPNEISVLNTGRKKRKNV